MPQIKISLRSYRIKEWFEIITKRGFRLLSYFWEKVGKKDTLNCGMNNKAQDKNKKQIGVK